MQPRVLIVEDDLIIQLSLKRTFSQLGAEVVATAKSGPKAIELATREEPDLIVIDVGLKGDLDGIETITRIQETSNVKVVYITGNSDETDLARAKLTNPMAFLLKPIGDHDLRDVLERLKSS